MTKRKEAPIEASDKFTADEEQSAQAQGYDLKEPEVTTDERGNVIDLNVATSPEDLARVNAELAETHAVSAPVEYDVAKFPKSGWWTAPDGKIINMGNVEFIELIDVMPKGSKHFRFYFTGGHTLDLNHADF